MLQRQWHEKNVDPKLFLELQDLTTVLSNISDMTFEFAYGSYIDVNEKRVTASTFWETTKEQIRKSGYKTDIYLRAIGTIYYSHFPSLYDFSKRIEETNLNNFSSQLVTLLENIRLEKKIVKLRPGTKLDFIIRQSHLYRYFLSQMKMNATRGFKVDELFCLIYLTLFAENPNESFPHANDDQLETIERIKFDLYDIYNAQSTEDVALIATKVMWKMTNYKEDMKTIYFTFPIFDWHKLNRENTLFDELTRTDDVVSYTTEDVDEDDQTYFDETFSTWHDEHKNEGRKETFLQMNLDVGTKTNLTGGTARDTESGDQVYATAQGMSQKSRRNDYSTKETLENYDNKKAGHQNDAKYGEVNIHAVKKIKKATKPSEEEIILYNSLSTQIEPYKRKLTKSIENMLEHKYQSNRTNLRYGRLAKNLLPIVLEEQPRLFYKKDEQSNEFDAVFTLMIDCSASMEQKMDETKKGIVLFHNVLKSLHIPHKIVGFWEEATLTIDDEYPNYFHIIHSFSDSLYEQNGPKIAQLNAEEDNRDGFSIRVITEKMVKRHEKHKFLLIFSDGEPAAMNYDDIGIVDTHLAVLDARKKGINVIGMFLADGEINKREDNMMKHIYGRERIVIPNVSQLPEQFAPILKKLLIRTI